MEPLQKASAQSAKPMEPQYDIGNGVKTSTTQQPVGGTNILSSCKELSGSFSSNCSSPDTPLDSSFSESDSIYELTPEEDSSNLLTTESPSTQVMERPTDEPQRIPSSLSGKGRFRKELGWSMGSNESLFSIQLDHSSFSRDQFTWDSEELCQHEEASEGPATEASCSPVRPSSSHITELARGGGIDAAEASMRDFLRDSKYQNNEKCCVEGRTSRYSDESGASGRSFAFPILSGDIDKNTSAKVRPDKKQPPQSLILSEQEGESLQNPQSEQQVAVAPKQWFSCFLCCSFCS
ncbi:unnamed protein product [Cuscuta epithymum]|uniref:Uncharacterized protein n=1 Tax=Cuscuta epithymum TaxID=186058 RepID=A0AAV0G7J8_9ASTE|nr:unnamed protein product [Cuscuta epithymum]